MALLMATPCHAAETPFGREVTAAVERGLEFFRARQNANGSFDYGDVRGVTGLVILAFLDKRESADWNAPAAGYTGMTAADQDRIRRAVAYLINNDPGLSGGQASSYITGSSLMALSLYLQTGGDPIVAGAPINVQQAIQNGVAGLSSNQVPAGANLGGWDYERPRGDLDGDLSTTQFVAAGLSAASARI